MSRKIDKHVTPMYPWQVWGGGFTEEECDLIIQAGELSEFEKASIGLKATNEVNMLVRNTDIVWIQPSDDTKWIFERMNEIISKINFDKFQMDLDRFDGFQYSKYGVDCHYDWHTDVIENGQNGLFRKLSISLMLSDPKDFKGGNFLITASNESGAHKLKLKKGDIVVFYSHLHHKVSKVTEGERSTLVTWALGEKIK
jgi:PKHD-type hydroxylase